MYMWKFMLLVKDTAIYVSPSRVKYTAGNSRPLMQRLVFLNDQLVIYIVIVSKGFVIWGKQKLASRTSVLHRLQCPVTDSIKNRYAEYFTNTNCTLK